MTPEQYERLTEVFHALTEVAPKDRRAFLKRMAGGDADLERELESLLAAYEREAPTQTAPDDIAAAILVAHQDGSAAMTASFVPNTRLARYEIRSLLGKGGMGEVYLAEDMRLHRKVALKILPAKVVSNHDRMRRFEQEAQAAAALNHPNIAHIYEIGESESTHFIAIEYIDGHTLRDKIHRDKAPLQKLLNYLIQVAGGLSKAHAAGIVHRDLKPDNIMITNDDYAKIVDFGLAKLIEPRRPFTSNSNVLTDPGATVPHSLSGMVMGTTGYMSPEQAEGRVKEIDHRSDIFSFGCILFEAVTRRRAFVHESIIKSLHGVVYESLPPIKEFNPSAPPDLQGIIRRCLAKDREDRYQTIKDVAIELKHINLEMAGVAHLDSTSASSTPTQDGLATEQLPRSTQKFYYWASQIRRLKLRPAIILATLILAVSAFVYFSYSKHNAAPVLTGQDGILLVGFDNRTGDADFDRTLRQALMVHLEQSPFLNILSDEQLQTTLLFMTRPSVEPLAPEVAREICQRNGLKIILKGSIAPLGDHYVLALEASNAQMGDVLARTQAEANGKNQVLQAIRMAANELRQKLGESPGSIQKFDVPLEQATTSSLEAFKNFFPPAEVQSESDALQNQISRLKRATELDPNFALAYAKLSGIYFYSEQRELASETARKAFELKDRVTEWERLGISIRYYGVTNQWNKLVETAQLSISTYPNKSVYPFFIMAMNYRVTGQYEKAIEAANESIRQPPAYAEKYENLGKALTSLNRFAEAKEAFEQGLKEKDSTSIREGLYALAFVNRDSAAMQQQLDAVSKRKTPLSWRAETAAFAGQRRLAHELALTEQSKPKEVTAQFASLESLWDAAFGLCQQSKAEATQVFTLPDYHSSLSNLGLALALCGESVLLQKLITEVKKRYPENSFVNDLYIPMIQAAGDIKHNNPALALQRLETLKYEALAGFWPRYLRGQAYLKLRRLAEASVEFQKILDHRGEDPLSFLYPLAHVGLARAAALAGDSYKSRKAYEDFFALWKDADADLPVLIEAKKEYERVR